MNQAVNNVNASRIERICGILAAAVVLIGCLILMGWAFDVPFLKSGFPGLQAVKVNAALAFILCAASLWFSNSRRDGRLAQGLAMVAILLSLLTLGEHLLGWNLWLDQILIKDIANQTGAYPGRMAPLVCLNFVILGTSLFFLKSRPRMAQMLASLGIFLALTGITSFLYYESKSTFGFLSYTQMPLLSSLTFLILSAGILCLRPEEGIMARFISKGPGGIIIRRLLFPLSVLLIIIGFAEIMGEKAGYFEPSFGRALTTLASVSILVGLLWWNARNLDATDEMQKRSTEELQKSEERYRLIVETANEGIWLTDSAYNTTFVNRKMADMLGHAPEEMLGHNVTEFMYSIDLPDLEEKMQRRRQGFLDTYEWRFCHPDGSERWMHISVTPLKECNITFSGFLAMLTDITERKRTEIALQESERKYRNLYNYAQVGLFETSLRNATVIACNQRYCDLAGFSSIEEAIGQDILSAYVDPADRDEVSRILRQQGHIDDHIVRFRNRRTGRIFWGQFSARYNHGCDYAEGSIIDMTESVYAEEALRETKDYLDKLIGYANAPIIVWDPLRKIVRFNKAFERLTGYSAEEVLGKDLSLLFPEVSREHSLQKIDSAVLGDQWESVEIPILNKSGEARIALWNSANIYAESGELQATIAQGQDITERKSAEDELALYARRLTIVNLLDRVVTSGLDIEQVYDRFVENLRELAPIDRTSVVLLDESREHWTVAMMWSGNELIIGKGEWRDVKGSAIEWLVNQKLPLVEGEIGEKGDWTESEPLLREGIRSRVLLPLITMGEVTGVLDLASRKPAAYGEKDLDILMHLSDQFSLALQNSRLYNLVKKQSSDLEVKVEERTAQLLAANKELEAFSYSVSHDLRAPLRAVDGFSRILQEEHNAELSPDAQHYLDLVRSNAVQMSKLIDDLLTFSRTSRQPLAKRLVNPAKVVEQVLEELHGELQGRNVEVIVGDLPHCQADPAMLERIFFNLLSNAVKFTRKREVAHIDIGSINNEGKTAYFVKDNGVGFDMNYSDKLFGVFSRLHSESDYEGTGVGLALVARIVHRHGGSVWAEAEVDKGATFYFTLEEGGPL
jgi:PAS domain S-box-containing protein